MMNRIRYGSPITPVAVATSLVFLLFSVPVARAADTSQDFAATFSEDLPPRYRLQQSGTNPGPSVIPDGMGGNALLLTQAVNSQAATVAFNQVYSGGYDLLQISADFLIDNGPGGADGFGIAYLNSSGTFGSDTNSPTPSFAEEPNLAGSFGVGFDTFQNSGGVDGPAPGGSVPNSVSINYDGAMVSTVNLDALSGIPGWLESGVPMRTDIIVQPVGGGSNVTVVVTDGTNVSTPFVNEFVAGLSPYDGRIAIGGRTGGANANQVLDNISLTITPNGGVAAQMMLEDFETPLAPPAAPPVLAGGTPYDQQNFGNPPGPALLPETAGAVGAAPGFLRLVPEAAGQFAQIAFDKTSDATASITAQFDLRILDGGAMGRADGLSFLLVPTDTYGDSGPLTGTAASFSPAEEPNLAGALGVGFDTFNNDTGGPDDPEGMPNTGNHISLSWNGVKLGQVNYDLADFDLVNNVWNNVTVQVNEVGDDLLVTVVIIDGTDGSVQVPFSSVLIPNASFPGGARAVFAARTGGAADNFDLDNLVIHSVPEPASLCLLGIGTLGLTLLRRRRRRG